jgi:hypothetical protein
MISKVVYTAPVQKELRFLYDEIEDVIVLKDAYNTAALQRT